MGRHFSVGVQTGKTPRTIVIDYCYRLRRKISYKEQKDGKKKGRREITQQEQNDEKEDSRCSARKKKIDQQFREIYCNKNLLIEKWVNRLTVILVGQ